MHTILTVCTVYTESIQFTRLHTIILCIIFMPYFRSYRLQLSNLKPEGVASSDNSLSTIADAIL